MPPTTKTIELPKLSIRALPEFESIDVDAREIGVVWAAGARVITMDWEKWEPFVEVLDMAPSSVMLDRLNNGGPVLDSHGQHNFRGGNPGLEDQVGVVVNGTASVDGERGHARIKISEVHPDVWTKIQERVIQNLSARYRVHRFVEEGFDADTGLPIRRAILWEPTEISLLPVPADPDTTIRSARASGGIDAWRFRSDGAQFRPVQVQLSSEETMPPEDDPKPNAEQIRAAERDRIRSIGELAAKHDVPDATAEAWIREGTSLDAIRAQILEGIQAPAPENDPPADPEPAPEDAVAVERARSIGVMRIARRHGEVLGEDWAATQLESERSLQEIQAMALTALAEQDDEQGGNGPRTRVVTDERETHRAGLGEALCKKLGVRYLYDADQEWQRSDFKPGECGVHYSRMPLVRMFEEYECAMGRDDARHLAPLTLAQRALHSTSDFPLLFKDAQEKLLRQAYQETPSKWGPLVRSPRRVKDFKDIHTVAWSNTPDLIELADGEPIKMGTMEEVGETYRLVSYARGIGFTRRAMVNDDLQALATLLQRWGNSARRVESDVFWALFTSNPTLGQDSTAVFHANHNNTVTGVISETSLNDARTKLRRQTDPAGHRLDLEPAFLIVAPEQELAAQKNTAQVEPTQTSGVNPFSGVFRGVIVEPRLPGPKWYIAGDPSACDLIEVAVLEGQEGPMVDSEIDFSTKGMSITALYDFAAAWQDFRNVVESSGA